MKKCFYLLAAILFAVVFSAQAVPGDTTWVQANNRRIDNGSGYGNYDTAVVFPSGTTSYRKIYMVFTLGEYACPSGSQYCHQWDYTVTNYLLTPTDTLELTRFITPFATSGTPRFPSTWTKNYAFDVTDFYPKLQGNAISRIFYSGYSAGFTANVRFAFIEGTPERNVLGINKLWNGSWSYGKASDPIDNHVIAKTNTAPANTKAAAMKFTITGHGSDNNQCCEFASHNYSVKVNSNVTETKAIWRDNCGVNPLYPQGGTWVFDRGNWCPGDLVTPNVHNLPGVTAGNSFTADVDFDAYTAGNTSYGSYTVNGLVFYYDSLNRNIDASLTDIIAPTTADEHFRENPSSASPIVRIRNTGKATITSAVIKYGVQDSSVAQYTWNGQLASLHDTIITLPALNTISNMSFAGITGKYKFFAEIAAVNGATDNDTTNNKLVTTFVAAPTWPSVLTVTMQTNNAAIGGVSETSWAIMDMNNNVIASRTNAAISTLYSDTVSIPRTGYYKLTITDAGCDGLQWWPYSDTSLHITAGSLTVKRTGALPFLPMNGYNYSGLYNNDFGCSFTQYFSVKVVGVGVSSVNATAANMQVYPNPATSRVAVLIDGMNNVNGRIEILDMTGRTVIQKQYTGGIENMDISSMPGGIYQVVYKSATQGIAPLTKKLVVTK